MNLRLVFFIFSLLISHVSLATGNIKVQKVASNVYALVGSTDNRSAENLGNNATFGVIVTKDGVVLIDSGGTFLGAKEIAQTIKSISNKPVKIVINSGGQDHRWLGNSYFKSQGAKIIASENAVKDHKARLQSQLIRLGDLVGDKVLEGTEPTYATETFKDKYLFEFGGVSFEIYHKGQAHTPGDSFIWLPKQKIMFTGDIVYIERMLGVGSMSNSKSWINVFEQMAKFKPLHIIPGHGQVTTLARAKTDSYQYLKFLRQSVADFIDDGGELADISKIDQSKYQYLLNFNSLSRRNAQQVFTEMEWE